jgi:farnesyl-diphosphate farnesyltransferase
MTGSQHAFAAVQSDALAYQDAILPKVSRTFALTIPQLPSALRVAVTNAYLLCRVADTIEDEATLSAEEKQRHEDAFVDAVTGRTDPQRFAAELGPLLSAQTLEAERDLVNGLPLVLQVTRSLRPVQQAAIVNCLKVMSQGMWDFQRDVGLQGLETLGDMDRYCYCVAGVVGEMLTELFIDFEPALAARRDCMMRLAVSFGQGLQMTNILKDQWEDRSHGACWLPQDVFARRGVRLVELHAGQQDGNYADALTELIGVAHAHLRRALEYTLLIPARHAGLRRFCLWSVGLAVLTLRNLRDNTDFSSGTEIKVSHNAVAGTIVLTKLATKYNSSLRWMFTMAARQLPLTPLAAPWSEPLGSGLAWPKSGIAYLVDTDLADTDLANTDWYKQENVQDARQR